MVSGYDSVIHQKPKKPRRFHRGSVTKRCYRRSTRARKPCSLQSNLSPRPIQNAVQGMPLAELRYEAPGRRQPLMSDVPLAGGPRIAKRSSKSARPSRRSANCVGLIDRESERAKGEARLITAARQLLFAGAASRGLSRRSLPCQPRLPENRWSNPAGGTTVFARWHGRRTKQCTH